MNHREFWALLDHVRTHRLPNGHAVPVLAWGLPGVGKSAGVEGYCVSKGDDPSTRYGFAPYLPGHDVDGAGLVGSSYRNEVSNQEHYAPPLWLPTDEAIAVGAGVFAEKHGVLFIDEVNRSTPAVRGALLSLVNDDKIPKSGYELPHGWSTVMAANPPESGNEVEKLDPAFMDRAVHVWLEFEMESWLAWARRRGLSEATIAFAAERQELLARNDRFDLPDSVAKDVVASPRSFEFLGTLTVPGMDKKLLLDIACGLIGKEEGAVYVEHVREYEAKASPTTALLTAEHIITGQFEAPLAAELAAGAAGVERAVRELGESALAKHGPHPGVAAHIACFLRQVGPERARAYAKLLHEAAPAWTPALREAHQQLRAPSPA